MCVCGASSVYIVLVPVATCTATCVCHSGRVFVTYGMVGLGVDVWCMDSVVSWVHVLQRVAIVAQADESRN